MDGNPERGREWNHAHRFVGTCEWHILTPLLYSRDADLIRSARRAFVPYIRSSKGFFNQNKKKNRKIWEKHVNRKVNGTFDRFVVVVVVVVFSRKERHVREYITFGSSSEIKWIRMGNAYR